MAGNTIFLKTSTKDVFDDIAEKHFGRKDSADTIMNEFMKIYLDYKDRLIQ